MKSITATPLPTSCADPDNFGDGTDGAGVQLEFREFDADYEKLELKEVT